MRSATILGALVLSLVASAAGELRVSEKTYLHQNTPSPAFVIENDRYAATLVPSRGGRILEWIDKTTGRNLVYDNDYGGLLDDHGARFKMPYEIEWLARTPQEVAARLTLDEGTIMRKTVRFFADRPVIQVTYHIENHGQDTARLLFRNVVRPAGTAFTGDEIYCYSRVVGLQRAKGMPRTDDQADPWCALADPRSRTVVAAAFEGDALERLYTWEGSKVAPTFEFMFRQLEAGRQVDITYHWLFAHGLTAVDYAHRAFLAQIEGTLTGETLSGTLDLAATWAAMPDLTVSGQVLHADRKPLADLKPAPFPIARLDAPTRLPLNVKTPPTGDYVILILRLQSAVLGEAIEIEKAFPRDGNEKLLAPYRRPVRWIGAPVAQKPLPDWKKEVAYEARPDDADRRRGRMIFEETGPRAGQHTTEVAFDLAQREPEAFPLHFHSLTRTGEVRVRVTAPAGLTVETFVPEFVPEKLWGKVVNGLKLNPADRFAVNPGDDILLYFRLRAGDLPPGRHAATIAFEMDDPEPDRVTVNVRAYPVRFPSHPILSFDVNNVVNYLCATGKEHAWAPAKARNYLADMAAHGVRGQTVIGTNAPTSHYWYDRVKVRPDGAPLPEAVRKEPARFRETLALPALDFSFWDPMIEWMLEHGQTNLRWPMGGCGPGFMASHARLTQMVYGRSLPAGDLRDMALKEWYFREVGRYFRDRGVPRLMVTIDDEIPSEELAWWVQHAYRCIQMGLDPGVTQSAETIADNTRINMIAPFMKYWIIGTLNKAMLDLRREQGVIRPEHWVTTYHSSACHWQPYHQMRGHCGLNPAFFDLNACWIQVYWRWRQSEAVIYPGEDGPTSSAAWEGARDGLDDGNFLLLARAMISALPAEDRASWNDRLTEIVGTKETSLVRFMDRMSGVGMVTMMGRMEGRGFKAGYDTAVFREAKRRLLDLVVELAARVPAQRAAADFGLRPIIRDGRSLFQLPAGMAHEAEAVAFLRRAAGDLAFETPAPQPVDAADPYPVLFVGTISDLKTALPRLAAHEGLADLDPTYPAPGSYVMRFLRKTPDAAKKEKAEDMPESLVILGGDEAGIAKAVRLLPHVVTPPKFLYSHWLPEQFARQ